MLLLLMYIAPLVAVVAWWWSRSTPPATATEERTIVGPAELLRNVVVRSGGLRMPVAGAFAAASLVSGAAMGIGGILVFLLGVLLSLVAAATVVARGGEIADSAVVSFSGGGSIDLLRQLWADTASIALALSALVTGCIGGLAWFFADPAGAVMLAAFSAGTAAGAVFLIVSGVARMAGDFPIADRTTEVQIASLTHSAELVSVHIAAVTAALLFAAVGPAESLLSLGGLLAETETLRGDLLLFPIAVTTLAPLLTIAVTPLTASLLARRGARALFDAERGLALLFAVAAFVLVSVCGLALAVAGAFCIGLVARQSLLIVDAAVHHGSDLGRPRPGVIGLVVAVAVVIAAERTGGWYGVTLAALGMTSTFAPAIASATARGVLAAAVPGDRASTSGSGAADGAASVTTTLAVIVAFATVASAASLREGMETVSIAAISVPFLVSVLAGAALARGLSSAVSNVGHDGLRDSSVDVRFASHAMLVAVLLPALLGMFFGSPAALGALVGLTAWVADCWPRDSRGSGSTTFTVARFLTAPAGGTGHPEAESNSPALASALPFALPASDLRLAGEAMSLRAWARAMALSALAAAPLMV